MRYFRSRTAWAEYRAEKQKGFPYSGTACYKLDDGYGGAKMTERAGVNAFFPYWAALELIKEGQGDSLNISIPELLVKCKENYAHDKEYRKQFMPKNDTYKGYPLNWECFRPYDMRYNDPGYGIETKICTFPFRANKEEKKELYDLIYTPFVDPICDGRDCTGAKFTGSIRIYTTAEKTVIFHLIHTDV